MKRMPNVLDVAAEVADAIAEGRPVVAMESSAVSHGLPYPDNLETAGQMEKEVRAYGAVPARVGIVDGRLVVGLSAEELDRFAVEDAASIPKVSVRDVGRVLVAGGLGAATVSTALLAAGQAGVDVFCTAGVGGVHYEAQSTFDISPDLVQFGRTPMAVVCAGAKSILDPALTLEYLETLGVPVIGYGVDDFPAYYSVRSGVRNPHRLDSLEEIARVARAHWAAGSTSSVVVTHPIEADHEIPIEQIREVIEAKLLDAQRAGVTGPELTPYVLKGASEATRGRTGEANKSVLVSTSGVAGRLAAAMETVTTFGAEL